MIRAKGKQLHLIVEDGSWDDIRNHNYRTQFSPKAFHASLMSFQAEFNLNVHFMPKAFAGKQIHDLLYYHIRNYLLGGAERE